MKKVAVFGLVFALFLLPVFMPLVKADNTVHKAKTLHREHKQRVRVRKIRQRLKTRNKGFLEGLTVEERQAAKEQRQERREERRGLLQKPYEEKLKEQKNIQEQKRKLREYHKYQRRNRVKKAGQELQPELKEGPAQQEQGAATIPGNETMHQERTKAIIIDTGGKKEAVR